MTTIKKQDCKQALDALRAVFPGIGQPRENAEEELQEALEDLDILTDQDEDGSVFLDGFNVDSLEAVKLLPKTLTALMPFLVE